MKKYTLWHVVDDDFNPTTRWRDHETGEWADDVKEHRFWVPLEEARKVENALLEFIDEIEPHYPDVGGNEIRRAIEEKIGRKLSSS